MRQRACRSRLAGERRGAEEVDLLPRGRMRAAPVSMVERIDITVLVEGGKWVVVEVVVVPSKWWEEVRDVDNRRITSEGTKV